VEGIITLTDEDWEGRKKKIIEEQQELNAVVVTPLKREKEDN
jgi:hypothetical protein